MRSLPVRKKRQATCPPAAPSYRWAGRLTDISMRLVRCVAPLPTLQTSTTNHNDGDSHLFYNFFKNN